MSNPLRPGVKLNKRELSSQGGITSRTIPGNTNFRTGVQIPPSNPFGKQGNVTGGSNFSHGANHESIGGNSDAYRVPAKPKFMRLSAKSSGFGAVKQPTKGKSPMGVSPDRKVGNFGRV
jgi:hypothetical protein